jgi:hypothetical protein
MSTYRARLGLTGRVGDRRIRGLASATIDLALTREAIGLEAGVSGQTLFRLGGRRDEADLLLRDPARVVRAPAESILEALIGVRLGPDRLLDVFGGCISSAESFERALRHGDVLEIMTGDATVYLDRQNENWRARAGRLGDLAIDNWNFSGGVPRDVSVRSTGSQAPRVDLTLRVQEVAVNSPIDPSAFRVAIPAEAVRLPLAELRDAGPLGSTEAP